MAVSFFSAANGGGRVTVAKLICMRMQCTSITALRLSQQLLVCCSPGCVVYSIGSYSEFSFESELLNRTNCDIHVFDPTVLPSKLREREAQLNRGLPRRRIWWHSIGIGIKDDESGVCAPSAFAVLLQLTLPVSKRCHSCFACEQCSVRLRE